ncbi:uncharacterized protein [Oryza sativa Japonica Group]|uniref:Hydrolase, alpha/beta fold family protein, expressed n=4 Tax=Oryza TaxID=4527 RepID=Q10N00_ORYSJ|nr:uncharacterized protein LOC4332488 [Oryza sativa Japonica Group]KAB8091318.1 hypothetical protein EE612_016764 [Oryza sativa]ABF95374.1 hydrolase, alpha/beta fold family protein, expressed [Oryza sativa Japonica Group]KAF2938713.1 hypothetical protein DAI22_03g138100 [Oryza sativa Japonica Group]BAF11697.1 Os03g0288300 [Oryza sativa Japonica Group]BAG94571.1 unnamed protein product [Oryza sativa Japonica Group]|eukprot:NP_001049783.1 Os03g0288300 [Oryza sativa Japonica Group]
MAAAATMTWHEELATLVGDTGVRFPGAGGGSAANVAAAVGGGWYRGEEEDGEGRAVEEEGWAQQARGFLESTAEMLRVLGRGLWDIAAQSLAGAEDSELARRLRGPAAAAGKRLSFMNEYLPEDRDPVWCWVVVAAVAFVTLIVLGVGSVDDTPVELPKKLYIGPPSAKTIQLPDGRHLAYKEQGVTADRARFSLIAPHSFLSSRLAGIPGIKPSLLEEFGARLVTYDLPGFGESDPHPGRDLNSSAHDMLHLAGALRIVDKFWVVGYSAGSIHAWSALRHIPDRVAGAAMFAPMANPYDSKMTKEERRKTWERWSTKRKLMHILARRFPALLPLFYHRSFLSGKQGQPESWLSLSLGKKDKTSLESPMFNAFWEKDVAESVRQGDAQPFVEEAVLQVSDWGFSLSDIQMQKREDLSFFELIKSLFRQAEREWVGFLGPIHIWQGMDDRVVPPSVTEYVRRVVPGATVHKLLDEGHFSYFCFCDECHRQIFSTLFGIPQGPINPVPEPIEVASELTEETTVPDKAKEEEQDISDLA